MGDAACARVRQLKQIRELQQEPVVLLQGLEMMARGREWYQQQLQRLQERQHRLGQSRASSVSDAAPWARLHPHPCCPFTFLRIPRGLGRRYEVSLLELYLPESCEFIHRRT